MDALFPLRQIDVFGFRLFRTAAYVLLIAAVVMQPAAALGVGAFCQAAEGGVCCAEPALDAATCCRDSDASSCCGGDPAAAGERERSCCCEHAIVAGDSLAGDSLAEVERACTCGRVSQPLSDAGSRSTNQDHRTPSQLAFAAFATTDALSGGESRRGGVAWPPSPPRFSQRCLCIWRL
ncbi:hypothetical protein [Candidatus Laterigemmans baculatus]|uniref:hypothetical protein n=1 Tax=Candidatus Laterigemmans baculatus TaxID=2770505 RepID=UPI0013DCC996|nr:hypothetical protein [Candidatus Laterigemmans baculatus]